MTERIHVQFERPRSGWMRARLRAGPSHLEVWASYTPHDSISDLAGALSLILKGGPEAHVFWNEEPSGYEFRFVAEGSNVRLAVLSHADSRRTAGGKEVLAVEGDRQGVCLPFWRALRRLESFLPPDEYEAAWSHRFPHAKMRDIAAIVAGRGIRDVPR